LTDREKRSRETTSRETRLDNRARIHSLVETELAWVAAVVVGAVLPIQMVWDFSDVANGLMAVPNLISLIVLSGVIAAETKVHRGELTGEADHEGR
jgi:Na+/alanine symporter